jgi:molybdopterin molybdotransferase
MGLEADHLGIAGDSEAAIEAHLPGPLPEVLIVIGGASGGRHDRVRHALAARG